MHAIRGLRQLLWLVFVRDRLVCIDSEMEEGMTSANEFPVGQAVVCSLPKLALIRRHRVVVEKSQGDLTC